MAEHGLTEFILSNDSLKQNLNTERFAKENMQMTNSTVVFCCNNCGAGYQAVQQGQAEQIPGRFDCQICGSQIVAWADAYEYVDWKAIETVRVPNTNDGPRRPRLRY